MKSAQASKKLIWFLSHCGDTTAGQYLNTLTVTDLATGWTECLAIQHKSQHLVAEAIRELRIRLPFPLLGIDSGQWLRIH